MAASISNTVDKYVDGQDGVAGMKFKESQSNNAGEGDYAEMSTASTSAGAWKNNNGGIPGLNASGSSAKSSSSSSFNSYNSKPFHSTNGSNGGTSGPSHGRYGSNSFHERDERARNRYKYNKPPPKIVVPIVTDKEEDWPTLGAAVGPKKATIGTNGNNSGLLNGFTAKNHKPSTSTTSPSSSSRANSIIGHDDHERASVAGKEGDNSHSESNDQIDGELSNKLRDDCSLSSDGNSELPKETNNNETLDADGKVAEKKPRGRGKLKWKPLALPAISPNRPLRPRRWEERDSTPRNGVQFSGPRSRVVTSTITTVVDHSRQNDHSHEGTSDAADVHRGRGQHRGSYQHGRGESRDDDSQSGDHYDDRRRGNHGYGHSGGRAYYGGRPRGGGGRWHPNNYSRGGGGRHNGDYERHGGDYERHGGDYERHGGDHERHNRHDVNDVATASASNDVYRSSQDNYHAGHGGENANNDEGAMNNKSSSSRGGRNGDYKHYRNSQSQQHFNDFPADYTELSVSYPYDGPTAIVTATSDAIIPTTTLTITTTILDPTVLTSSSPSPSITTTVHQFVMPYTAASQSPIPLLSSPVSGLIAANMPTTMEQVVDESRLRAMVEKQIKYYLSEENLEQDFYLRRQMNREGYIGITVLASFHRLKGMTNNLSLILDVIMSCPNNFELSEDLTRVRPRSNPTIWPVVSADVDIDLNPTENSQEETLESYVPEYPPVEVYAVAMPITTIAGVSHGYQFQPISSASSAGSLLATSNSMSPGPFKSTFRLNPDVAEFVPRFNYSAPPVVSANPEASDEFVSSSA